MGVGEGQVFLVAWVSTGPELLVVANLCGRGMLTLVARLSAFLVYAAHRLCASCVDLALPALGRLLPADIADQRAKEVVLARSIMTMATHAFPSLFNGGAAGFAPLLLLWGN